MLSFQNSTRFFRVICPEVVDSSPQFDYANYVYPDTGVRMYPFPELVFTFMVSEFSPENLKQQLLPFHHWSMQLEKTLREYELADRQEEALRSKAASSSSGGLVESHASLPMADQATIKRMRLDHIGEDDLAMERQARTFAFARGTTEKRDITHAMSQFGNRILAGDSFGMQDPISAVMDSVAACVIESPIDEAARYMLEIRLRARSLIDHKSERGFKLMTDVRREGLARYLSFMNTANDKLPNQFRAMVIWPYQRRSNSQWQPLFNVWCANKKMSLYGSYMASQLSHLSHTDYVYNNLEVTHLVLFNVAQDAFDLEFNRTPLHTVIAGETMSGKSMQQAVVRETLPVGISQSASSSSCRSYRTTSS